MATFTDKELEYVKSQRLARLATADSNNAPHVVPVGFRLAEDGTVIDVGGGNLAKSKKYRDLKANPKVAIVIDDLASIDPWSPRGIEVRGTAELHDTGGPEKFGEGWGNTRSPVRRPVVPDRLRERPPAGEQVGGAVGERARLAGAEPARRSNGPLRWITACACSGVSPASRRSDPGGAWSRAPGFGCVMHHLRW
jgi:pyridoxamine 5'-phosphate oxidase family protein